MSEWIQWGGGTSPVHAEALVEVMLRNGDQFVRDAGSLAWARQGISHDIVGYRLSGGKLIVKTAATEEPLKSQVGGSHYKDMQIQPVEFIHANGIGYMEGNVIKYVSRWHKKNGIADLEKAKHYIELLIAMESKE